MSKKPSTYLLKAKRHSDLPLDNTSAQLFNEAHSGKPSYQELEDQVKQLTEDLEAERDRGTVLRKAVDNLYFSGWEMVLSHPRGWFEKRGTYYDRIRLLSLLKLLKEIFYDASKSFPEWKSLR